MYYIILESTGFKKQVDQIWNTAERLAFFTYLAHHPLAGDVIPGSGGLRKIRWGGTGKGKRGGVRVIYYNLLTDGCIMALALYAKNERENLSPNALHKLQGEKP